MARPKNSERPLELLVPGGSLESAAAAIQYGADAVYVGLKRFSARAGADNLTANEVDSLVAHAHAQESPRQVYVTLNTVVKDRELPEVIEAIGQLAEIGVDAVLVQDLGVGRLIQKHFPSLVLHASTQMAVHNRQGVETLQRLGYGRVVLARELTIDEIRGCAAVESIEVECFIHGALCYSYSGLCLFSSHILGRSGNRGQCAQVCRNSFVTSMGTDAGADGRPPSRRTGMPFSMKDLALPDRIEQLRDAGVRCLKVEGRQKSPLYVAVATDMYRRLIDGELAESERAQYEEDLKTVFSRPWTELHFDRPQRDSITDTETTGHRGAPIGEVESVVLRVGRGGAHLRFRTGRRLEVRDGLQIDLPELYKPFGFSIERMRLVPASRRAKPRNVTEASAGSQVEVELPDEHPQIPPGATVYCSSSQQVKQRFRVDPIRTDGVATRRVADFAVSIAADRVTARASVRGVRGVRGVRPDGAETATKCEVEGSFEVARHPERTRQAARAAFGKLGETRFELGELSVENERGLFVPVSVLNDLRRKTAVRLQGEVDAARANGAKAVVEDVMAASAPDSRRGGQPAWSLSIDRAEYLDALEDRDLDGVDEVVIDLTSEAFDERDRIVDRVGPDRVRVALLAVARKWETALLRKRIDAARSAGLGRWECGNLSGWGHLGLDPRSAEGERGNLSTDWTVYVLNRLAALQVLEMGASRVTLSCEDEEENMRDLLSRFGDRATVVVYQDTPLFISEACPHAALDRRCDGPDGCDYRDIVAVSGFGEKVVAINRDCRTTVICKRPLSISHRQSELVVAGASMLRAEFRRRTYSPQQVADIWRIVRSGERVPDSHEGNYVRGLV